VILILFDQLYIERRSKGLGDQYEDFSQFNRFIDDNVLFDLPLCWRNFIWYRENGLSMSLLYHFLLSEEWCSI